MWDTLVEHSYGHSCGTLYLGQSCRTLLWVTLVGSSCGALFWDTLDTTNHPAHQRHAAFTPACFALPSGTERQANTLPTQAVQIPMALRHHERRVATVTRRVYASLFRAPLWHGATQTHFPPWLRKSQWHCDITNVATPHGLPRH